MPLVHYNCVLWFWLMYYFCSYIFLTNIYLLVCCRPSWQTIRPGHHLSAHLCVSWQHFHFSPECVVCYNYCCCRCRIKKSCRSFSALAPELAAAPLPTSCTVSCEEVFFWSLERHAANFFLSFFAEVHKYLMLCYTIVLY